MSKSSWKWEFFKKLTCASGKCTTSNAFSSSSQGRSPVGSLKINLLIIQWVAGKVSEITS